MGYAHVGSDAQTPRLQYNNTYTQRHFVEICDILADRMGCDPVLEDNAVYLIGTADHGANRMTVWLHDRALWIETAVCAAAVFGAMSLGMNPV